VFIGFIFPSNTRVRQTVTISLLLARLLVTSMSRFITRQFLHRGCAYYYLRRETLSEALEGTAKDYPEIRK
jgi:hypothetical protein